MGRVFDGIGSPALGSTGSPEPGPALNFRGTNFVAAQLRGGLRDGAAGGVAAKGGDQALDTIDDLRVLGGLQECFELGLGGKPELREGFVGGFALFPAA